MHDLDLDSSVSDWAIEHDGAKNIFEGFGIDYCCGGKSLAYACVQRGLQPQTVLGKLRESQSNDASPVTKPDGR